MVQRLLDGTSYSLIRTNPKLTTNVKLVSNGDDIFLDSFDANDQLSSAEFKAFKVNPNSRYDKDIHKFYQNGKFPKELAYEVSQRYENINVLNNYASQFEMQYSTGTEAVGSGSYKEDLKMLAPLWLNEELPKYFVIFRLDGPTSIDIKNNNTLDYLESEAQTSTSFSKFILEQCTAIKTFDLTENSNLGKYIKNYRFTKDFPVAPLTTSWRRDEPVLWNGISYQNGGFTSVGEYIFEDLVVKDSTIIQTEHLITKGFQRNGVILANLLNLEFLFDDENSEDYSLNRYFGLYVNEVEEGSFALNGANFHKKHIATQTPKPKKINTISNELNDKFIMENPNGLVLYLNDIDTVTGIPTPQRVNEVDSIFYVKDKDDNFHTIKKGATWGKDELRLFDKKIDISKLTGYREPDTYIKGLVLEKAGYANASFKVSEEIPVGFTISFYDGDEYIDQVSAEDTLTNGPGSSYQGFFNPTGDTKEIAKALSNAINTGISRSKRLFQATYHNDTVYITSLFAGTRFNRLKFQINWDVYNEVEFKTFPYTDENKLSSNLTGGSSDTGSVIRIEAGDGDRFENGYYVRSKSGYAQIIANNPYLEDPIKNHKGEITGYNNIDKYRLIILDDNNIELTSTNLIALYIPFKPTFGRFSFFPVRDFDFDFYSTKYSRSSELDYESDYYNTYDINTNDYIGVANNPEIRRFYDEGGFANLIGLLKDADPDFNYTTDIDSEYDRLEENYIKQQSVASRIIPYINKWGYFREGKDVRNNPYRLNLSEAFTLYNFAPDKRSTSRNADSFSHEWYYLSEVPEYFTKEAIENSWSYFNERPDDSEYLINANGLTYTPGTFQEINENRFDEFFISDFLIKNNEVVSFDRQLKYSRFFGGNEDNYAHTFFRGVKIIAKNKPLNTPKPNYNAKKLTYKRDGSINDYKFSAMLVMNSPNKPKTEIKFVKNDKWKTIVMMIFLTLDESCLTEGKGYIDRTSLYSITSNYIYDDNCEPVKDTDTLLTYENALMQGAISFLSSGAYLPDPSLILIKGQPDINGNEPEFFRDIRITLGGNYSPIKFTIDGDEYIIDGISKVISNDSLLCRTITKNGTPVTLPLYSPNSTTLKKAEYEIIAGGYNEFNEILNEVTFSEIFRKVNKGAPEIIYETINIDGTPAVDDDGVLIQTFSIELREQEDILKSVYLGALPDQNKPTVFNLIDIIGFNLSLQKKPRITPIARHNGFYEPITNDIIFFRDPYIDIESLSAYNTHTTTGDPYGSIIDESYKIKVFNLTRYANTQFYPDDTNFGIIENMFYHKVNEEDPSSILELSQQNAYKSLYPLINEIGIDYKDYYVFSSNWEPGYFNKSIDKSQNFAITGSRSMIEKKAFFGSKYLKTPDQINIDEFDLTTYNKITILNDNSPRNGNLMYNENKSSVEFFLYIEEALIEFLFMSIKPTFEKYLNPKFGIGDISTNDDDIKDYIKQNIIKQYEITNIDMYLRSTLSRNPNVYETIESSNLEKINKGLKKHGNFASEILNNNQLNTKIIYNKRSGYSEAFGFSITLNKK